MRNTKILADRYRNCESERKFVAKSKRQSKKERRGVRVKTTVRMV